MSRPGLHDTEGGSRVRAFMIALGDYLPLARVTAACFEWATGLAPQLITEASEPAPTPWLASLYTKLSLPDAEQYWCVDADLLFRQRVTLPNVPPEALGAVAVLYREQGFHSLPLRMPETMVSTGIFVASKEHRGAMALARRNMTLLPETSRTPEEIALNAAILELGVTVHHLDPKLNQYRITNALAPTLHFVDRRGPFAKMAGVRYSLRRHAPQALKSFLRERDLFPEEDDDG